MFDSIPDSPQETGPEDAARRKAWLVRLGEIGMAYAEATKADFDAAVTPEARREAMATFPQISRVVQRAVLLETRLEREDRIEARLMARSKAEAVRETIDLRRKRVQAVLEQVIDLSCGHNLPRHFEACESLRWRLDDCFLDRAFAERPLDEVIRILCKGLGLPFEGPLGEETDLWTLDLSRRPVPTAQTPEASQEPGDDPANQDDPGDDPEDDPEDDFDPLDPFDGRQPFQSSA